MEPPLLISNEVLNKLNCSSCQSYLSVFPIYLKEEGVAVCGRCPIVKSDSLVRDDAYENIARFIVFPCIYKKHGCTESLVPQNLEKHEKMCSFRKFDCPTKYYTRCNWDGPRTELIKHFEGDHPQLLLQEAKFDFDFTKNIKENLLLSHTVGEDVMIFVVRKEVDCRSNVFSCVVTYIGITEYSKNYYYRLRLQSGNKKHTHRLSQKIITFSANENVTEISAGVIAEKLYDPDTVTVSIEISDVCDEPVASGSGGIIKDDKVNYELLAELECPVCYEYMIPPIFQCNNGHSFCEICKPKITQCSLCEKPLGNTRNIVLEKMTALMYYPCKYRKGGCTFSSKPPDKLKHEQFCQYGPYECPFKDYKNCEWKAQITELLDHVDQHHKVEVLDGDKVSIDFESNDEEIIKSYFMKFLKRVFVLNFTYKGKVFYWSVHLVGPAEDSKQFKFDVDVIDNSNRNLRMYSKAPCSPLMDRYEAMETENCIILTLQQLKSFITQRLSFKVHVLKE